MPSVTTQIDWLRIPAKVAEYYPLYAAEALAALEADRDSFEIPDVGTVFVKSAAIKALAAPFEAMSAAQKPFGGPNPLLSMLLGGALGAGLGYGGAALTSKLLPEKYFDHDKMKHNWALAGGAAGAALPGYLYARPMVQLHGLSGLLKSSMEDMAAKGVVVEEDEALDKMAFDTGAAFAPVIPVDAFNNLLLNDANTPPALRAATAGLVTAASQSRGGVKLISPADIGRVAIGMGSGVLSAMLVGKTLGYIAGLRPEAQQKLQQVGAIAGVLGNIIPAIFQ